MDFLRRLFGGGSAATTPPDNALHLYVRCKRCGSPVHVRVNPANDLSVEYGDTAADGYFLRKEIMDAKCFRIMRAELRFDQNRRELSRDIEGGEFISHDEYVSLTQPPAPQ
jgi:hypothetical protein